MAQPPAGDRPGALTDEQRHQALKQLNRYAGALYALSNGKAPNNRAGRRAAQRAAAKAYQRRQGRR